MFHIERRVAERENDFNHHFSPPCVSRLITNVHLKNVQPDCQIDVLAPSWSFSLLERMPEVANAIAMPLSHGQFALLDRIKLGRKLKTEGYLSSMNFLLHGGLYLTIFYV